MNDDKQGTGEAVRVNKIRESYDSLDKEMIYVESLLGELLREADEVNSRVHQAKSEAASIELEPKQARAPAEKEEPKSEPPAAAAAAIPTPAVPVDENFKGDIEKLLQGSMDHLEDRLSQRILNMLKDLKVASGPARETKFREVREAVSNESVDLSGLFKHEKIESNIGDIGIEEKESQGIQSSLERLRKMRQQQGPTPPQEKKQ